jgi:chemotaxis response regulator CheB
VVYGMPRVLAEAGLTDRLIPIDEMAAAIHEVSSTVADLRHSAAAPGQG